MAGRDDRRKRTDRGSAATPAAGPAARVPAAVWAAVALAVLLVAFFNPLFFGGKVFQPPDQIASRAHQPYIQECLHDPGSIIDRYPLWTPYIFSGMPSFGSLIAAPYTNPLSFLLSFLKGDPKVVAYYFLLGLFQWLFLRRRGAGALPAFFGAASYVFCTHLITMIMFGHSSKIATLLFLPLVLLATDEIWKRPNVRWTAVLALAVGTMMVTSHLQIAYYTFLAAGLYLLVQSIFALRERMAVPSLLARWGAWVLGSGVGFAASSVIFLSVREYAKYSIRGGTGGGLPYDYATNWSLHPLEMTTFFVPSFFGFGQSTYWGWMPFTDFPLYMGILPLLLAIWTVAVWPRERLHVYLVVLGVFALFVAFGKHLPLVYGLLFNFLPFFNKFRVPSMITVLLQFSVASLAALGLARLAAGLDEAAAKRARRAFAIAAGAVAAVVAVLGGMMAGGMLNGQVAARVIARTPAQEGVTPAQMAAYGGQVAARVSDMAAGDLARVLIVLALGIALVWALLRKRIPAWAGIGGLLVLTLVDLWVVGAKPADYKTATTDANAFAETPTVRFLKGDTEHYRILPLTGQGLNNNWFAYFRIPSILGYSPAKLKIVQDLIDDQGPVGIRLSLSRGNFNIIDMLGTKYIVADPRTASAFTNFAEGRFTVAQEAGGESVLRNNGALPSMWFVDRARVVSDEKQHLAALADPTWKPSEEALLFEQPGAFEPAPGGTATITRYEPREIDATVETPVNGLLVMSEIYYKPGWHAFLDGKRVPIHRADYVLRAIEVPAGRHELKMRFDPGSFVRGAYVSAGAYLLALVALGVSFVPRRKREAGPAV